MSARWSLALLLSSFSGLLCAAATLPSPIVDRSSTLCEPECAFYLFTGVESRFGDLSGLGYQFHTPDGDILRSGFIECAYGGRYLNRAAQHALDSYRDTFNAQATPLSITDDSTSSWSGQLAVGVAPAVGPNWLAPLYGGVSYTRAEITPKVTGRLVTPVPGLAVTGKVSRTMTYDSADAFVGFRKTWRSGFLVDIRAGYSFELKNRLNAPEMPPGWSQPATSYSSNIDAVWARLSVGWSF